MSRNQKNTGFRLRNHLSFLPLFRKHHRSVDLPAYYIGKWNFTDDLNGRIHVLQITEPPDVLIDGRKLPGKIVHLDEKELLFLDNYGYHLRVDLSEHKPISLFDEADNQVYPVTRCETLQTNDPASEK
ncbi:MAG: DUF4828 domain-containing protein [Liquorilactobacillus satsumensis]|uniref:DUF4828 domain-containing protein n=2 Tax=Liquorilactobacillus satsumensis TaxID=259059 RepID=UPI0039E9C1C9